AAFPPAGPGVCRLRPAGRAHGGKEIGRSNLAKPGVTSRHRDAKRRHTIGLLSPGPDMQSDPGSTRDPARRIRSSNRPGRIFQEYAHAPGCSAKPNDGIISGARSRGGTPDVPKVSAINDGQANTTTAEETPRAARHKRAS